MQTMLFSSRVLLKRTTLLLLGSAAVCFAPLAHAQTINNLFNTGVDAGKAKITPANQTTADPHYSSGSTVFVEQNPNQSWVTSADSNYVAADGNDGSAFAGGVYTLTYNTTFTLPANVNLNSVNIQGGWSTDNLGNDILINGHSTGFSSPSFSTFTPFTLPSTFYQAGANTLGFNWTNQGGPGGLNVRFTTMTYGTVGAATPEPGSIALLVGMGMTGLGYGIRRKRRK